MGGADSCSKEEYEISDGVYEGVYEHRHSLSGMGDVEQCSKEEEEFSDGVYEGVYELPCQFNYCQQHSAANEGDCWEFEKLVEELENMLEGFENMVEELGKLAEQSENMVEEFEKLAEKPVEEMIEAAGGDPPPA
ncbi:MAG: hypothetical protein Q9221_003203 [Calogaya cf. arnoldii]